MKIGILASTLTSILLATFVARAEETTSTNVLSSAEIEKLIPELTPRRVFSSYRRKAGEPRKELSEFQKKKLEEAKSIIPKLRRSIQPGESIFDYNGLLAKGDINYREYSKEYTIWVGIPHSMEGIAPYEFQIVFDEKGIILSVDDLDVLH